MYVQSDGGHHLTPVPAAGIISAMSHLGLHRPPQLLTVSTAVAVAAYPVERSEVARERVDLAGGLPAGEALRNRYSFAGVDEFAQQSNKFRA